ncbi:MAG: DUF2075 domain-containing protein [Candidatus Cloacimonetes bacterium]|nr:DUF2075 domain-containing protein [Candidatus Cloacimonadota bacterium]
MNRYYYSASIKGFCAASMQTILGELVQNSDFDVNQNQRNAWLYQIDLLQALLSEFDGHIYFEFSIPRMGHRVDVILIIENVLFVLEFKVGESHYPRSSIDQVWDYALDLKNFHDTSHHVTIAPILLASNAKERISVIPLNSADDQVLEPILSNPALLINHIKTVLDFCDGPKVNPMIWEKGSYHPTPNIIEAALSLYNGHSVANIARSDAGAINLGETTDAILELINNAQYNNYKAICFVTGVPGAGKTLVGLNIATQKIGEDESLKGVFLSGNGPLVLVLKEALARDMVAREKNSGKRTTKRDAHSKVKAFVQNVHHFRDDCLTDRDKAPYNKIAIFDEAQRAWNREQTERFMRTKKHQAEFPFSEPDFLISCMDRHQEWAVIICLVGGGQEINTGEAGIGEWIKCLINKYPAWHIYLSDRLHDSEYDAGLVLKHLAGREKIRTITELHLGVSMRSFRAENVSLFVKQVLDLDPKARDTYQILKEKYPLLLCRDINTAKAWLRQKARGSERFGIVVSSQAYRLKPLAIDVRYETNPVQWFLNEKDDVRSSYYLEDVATEFHVQGLELDWTCVTWDADFRYEKGEWKYWNFHGDKWQRIHKADRQQYLKNAYRVLLTRARQGMVIVVPEGDPDDHTRQCAFYDGIYNHLMGLGIETL